MRARPPVFARASKFRQHVGLQMLEVVVLAEEPREIGGQMRQHVPTGRSTRRR